MSSNVKIAPSILSANFSILGEEIQKLEKKFIAPAYTFDNVKGKFPIGFKIWNTQIKEVFSSASTDIYNEKGDLLAQKVCIQLGKVII